MVSMAGTSVSNSSLQHSPEHMTKSEASSLVNKEREMVVKMPKDLLADLAKLAKQLGIDSEMALRYAISTTAYLHDERDNGATLLLERNNRRYEVEWLTPKAFARQFKNIA
jgi:hypothetical protein